MQRFWVRDPDPDPPNKISHVFFLFRLENFVNSGEKIELENFLINTGVVREVAQFMAKEGPKLLELNQAMFPFVSAAWFAATDIALLISRYRCRLN